MSATESDCIFLIVPDLYDPERGYPLCTIWSGTNFAIDSDFYCGHDLELAREFVKELNENRGHNLAFTTKAFELISGLSLIKFYNA